MRVKMDKKKITGVVYCLVLLLATCLAIPRLFFSSTGDGRRSTVQFIRKGQPVDLSKFSSQMSDDWHFSVGGSAAAPNENMADSWPRTEEEIRQSFDNYVYSTPCPKIPLFTEQQKRPASATASQQVVVADRGAATAVSTDKQERRGFRRSFTNEANEATVVASTQESTQFQAKLFSDVKMGMEAQVKVQVLEAFVLNGCEIKKNTILTALARRSGNRVDIYLSAIPACNSWVNCHFTAYSTDGQRGLYLNITESTLDRSSQTAVDAAAREASQAATGLLSVYGGVAGRVLGSGLNDALRTTGRVDNTVTLSEGTKILFKNAEH
jgi:hypothetical protein